MGVNQINQFIFSDPRLKLAKGLRGRTLRGLVCADSRSSVDAWTSSGLLSSAQLCLSESLLIISSEISHKTLLLVSVALLPVLISGEGTKTSPDTDAVNLMQANQR